MKQLLSTLAVGKSAVVESVNTNSLLKTRLYDIGLTAGTAVRVMHQSPAGNPRAYLIRGAVIALRNADAEKITVRTGGECNE